MILEMLSVGIILPLVGMLTQGNISTKYSFLVYFLELAGYPNQTRIIIFSMLILLIIYFVKNVFLAFLVKKQTSFAFGIQAELSQRLYANYIHQPYEFHLHRNSAQLIQNVTTEVNFFCSHALIPSMLVLSESLVILSIGGLLMFVEPMGTFTVFLFFGFTVFLFGKMTRSILFNWGEKRQLNEGLRLQNLQQALGGIKDVKLTGCENSFLSNYHINNLSVAEAGKYHTAMQQYPRLALEFLAVCGLCLLMIVKIIYSKNTEDIAPILSLFALAAFRVIPSVNRILGAIQTLKYMGPVINTLDSELSIQLNKSDVIEANYSVELFENNIHVDNISFSYKKSSKNVLKNVSFKIKKGSMVGLIGQSGSGKSTMVDIILGLLAPDKGSVFVDGNNIQANVRSWQSQIGYVSQAIYLIDDTIEKNIAFGVDKSKIDDCAMQKAIDDSQLREFIESLPDGLNTIVGERGARLSGGQRQRIGIARALYRQPKILIFDEATSALDINTEKDFMESINSLRRNKTILVVAHRLSTVSECDQLYLFDKGVITSSGEPKDVIAKMKKR